MANDKKSGFHYLGVGCLILGIVGVVGGVAVGVALFEWAGNVKETLADPDSRAQQVKRILGAETLPEGYYPMLGVSVPMLLETAILTNREPTDPDQPPVLGEEGLIYLSMLNFGRDREDLDAFFRGETDDPEALRKHGIQINLEERLSAGTLERASGPIRWSSHRGEMKSGDMSGRHAGLITMLQIHCPDNGRNRFGIWFGHPPEGLVETLLEESEGMTELLAGTIADPVQVEAFASHFRFCAEP